jgi:hypothetical protein
MESRSRTLKRRTCSFEEDTERDPCFEEEKQNTTAVTVVQNTETGRPVSFEEEIHTCI